jgi:hypothetical protein
MRSLRRVLPACLVVLGILVPAGARPAGAVVQTVPASIPANCAQDVTAQLQAFIDASPDGSTLSFTPNACYRVDGTLRIRHRNHLVLEGNHASFKAFTDGSELGNPTLTRLRAMFGLFAGTDITLRDIVVVGANPHAGRSDLAYRAIYEAQHAYAILGTDGVLLDHVEAYDVYGDFVNVGPGSNGVTVRNSTFLRNGRQGWTINGTNVLFEHNTIGETRRATIDMEPSLPTWTTRNVTIRDNEVGKGRLYFLASVGSSPVMDNITVEHNLLHRNMRMFVDPPKGTRSNYHIIGNVAEGGVSQQGGGAMGFRDIVNLEVRDNTLSVQRGRNIAGVSIGNCQHVIVTGNHFRGAAMPLRDFGNSVDVAQSGNLVGTRLVPAPTTYAAGPTPPYVRGR